MLHPDRLFDPDPTLRSIARELYSETESLPLVCPHGHVDPRLLADDEPFGDPTQLIIVPDHYVFRMLYSQGVGLESLGIPPRSPASRTSEAVDNRKVWQLFADHFHLFRGTPTALWLQHSFERVFGVDVPLRSETAMEIYDHLARQLARPEFRPRALFDSFGIEVLATTDAATDSLEHHRRIREDGSWSGRVVPTFRPDAAVQFLAPGWREEIGRLGDLSGREITGYAAFIAALESRRAAFRAAGATATDHGVASPFTVCLSEREAEAIFERALAGSATQSDLETFTGHMLVEFARMSVDDGLVMQIHPGSFRNHNSSLFERFGADKGADIPVAAEFTRNLRPLLERFGDETRLTLILFTLDESTYSRELAPLAGHYPALRLGPPWWFHDSREGMMRFRQRTTETAGVYNTVGFNDDTRAFPSIPARHDVSRRVDASYLARLVAEHVIGIDEAREMAADLAYHLARRAYRFDHAS